MGYDNREDKRMTKDQVKSCINELELNPNFKPNASGQAPTTKTFGKLKGEKK